MKKVLYLIGTLFTFYGCNKVQEENYPFYYVSSEISVQTDFEIFTQDGQINDKSIIDEYLRKDTLLYFLKKDSLIKIANNDTIIFQSKDKVLFSNNCFFLKDLYHNGNNNRIVKDDGGYTYFYMTDTSNRSIFIPVKDSVVHNIGIFKPYYSERSIPIYYGGGWIIKYFDAFLANRSSSGLEFPLITFKLIRWGNFNCSVKYYNNQFDKNVINNLQTGDTLMVQESVLTYTKK